MEAKGFFASLFDFSFRDFITPRIISILYGLSMAGIGLAVLINSISAFDGGVGFGIATLVFGAVVFLFGVIYMRVILEVVIVLFRIAGHVGELAAQGRGQQPTPPAA